MRELAFWPGPVGAACIEVPTWFFCIAPSVDSKHEVNFSTSTPMVDYFQLSLLPSIIQSATSFRITPRLEQSESIGELDGHKRPLVSSLSRNLQRFGIERVPKVQSLQEIVGEMAETSETNDTADCPSLSCQRDPTRNRFPSPDPLIKSQVRHRPERNINKKIHVFNTSSWLLGNEMLGPLWFGHRISPA